MKYLLLLLAVSSAQLHEPEYILGPHPIKTFVDDSGKAARAWTIVKHHYPISSTLVKKIKIAHINGIYCDCWGAVWPIAPTTIYLDVARVQVMTDLELQALLVHEMVHVVQFNNGHTEYDPELDRAAYAEQARYKDLKTLSSDIVSYE